MRAVARTSALILLLTDCIYGHEGWGVAIHDELGVIFSDIPGNTIWRIAGNRVEPLLRNVHSHALVVGHDRAVYGTNPEPSGKVSSVWRIDAAGRFSYVLPPTSGSPLGLQSFLIDSDGTIYSASRYDYQRPAVIVVRRERNGKTINLAGGAKGFADGFESNARFSGIDGMTQAADGKLVVADGVYLRTVTRGGHVSTLTRPLTRRRWGEDLLGVSSIRDEAVHVADHAGRRVLRVSLATGHAEEVDRSGFLWAPSGVELAQNGLYVLEHLRPPLSLLGDLQIGPYLCVRRVARGGSSTTLAVVWGRHSWIVAAILAIFLIAASWAANRLRLRSVRRTEVRTLR